MDICFAAISILQSEANKANLWKVLSCKHDRVDSYKGSNLLKINRFSLRSADKLNIPDVFLEEIWKHLISLELAIASS